MISSGLKLFSLSMMVARSEVAYNAAPSDFCIIHGGTSLVSESDAKIVKKFLPYL